MIYYIICHIYVFSTCTRGAFWPDRKPKGSQAPKGAMTPASERATRWFAY